MGKIIAIANQKGGVGKTTTSINLSACLAEKGKKVLVIDTDPQGNTTSGFGIEKNDLENTIYELILGECSIRDCIIKNVLENVSVLPANVNLAAAEIELIGVERKEYILKNEVDYVKGEYDFIIIDCPPSLNMLTINAMTTADSVLVPIQCEYYALEGLSQLIHTVNLVKERLNPELDMEGVVFTMYDSRTNLSTQVVENVKQKLPVLDSLSTNTIQNPRARRHICSWRTKSFPAAGRRDPFPDGGRQMTENNGYDGKCVMIAGCCEKTAEKRKYGGKRIGQRA